MRSKSATVLLALGVLAAAPAAAHAAPPAGVKLAGCQSGALSADRKATFVGHMHAVPGSAQLAMRFRLLEQYGGRPFAKVPQSDLRVWRKSRAGVQNYSYSQTVTALAAGEAYRAQVQFRWLDTNGKIVARATRVSAPCDQPGTLPNLKVFDVSGRAGSVSGTESFTVDILNAGLVPANHVALQLVVDGATPDTATIDSLAPGEIHPIHFTGPACRHRVRATVDPSDSTHESDERDNSLSGPCPHAS